MIKTDKLLIRIVAGIFLLVVVAFVITLSKPKPTYLAEDTPEGVAFNYLFALQQKDYERAYGYLSSSAVGYPRDANNFSDDIRNQSWGFDRLNDFFTTVEIDSVDVNGKRAEVRIRETYFDLEDLYNSGQYTRSFHMTLRQDENGEWKIMASNSYWARCWDDWGGCK